MKPIITRQEFMNTKDFKIFEKVNILEENLFVILVCFIGLIFYLHMNIKRG